MATVSSLAVVVTARTGSYNRNIKKAARSTTMFAATVAKLAKVFGAAAIATVTFKIATALSRLVTEQFKLVDQTGKLSDELGISVEALESYRLAAAITGTKQEHLTRGLQRLVRRLGEAASGYGEAVKGVRNLGLDAKKLSEMKIEDAISAIADGLLRMKDPATRAAAAFTLLGRQGQEIMNFFQLGSTGLAKFRKEVELYGTALSRVDVRQVEEWNDAFHRSKQVVVGFARQVALFLSPSLQDLAVRFTKATTSGGTMNEMVNELGNSIIWLTGQLKEIVSPVILVWDTLQAVFLSGTLAISQSIEAIILPFDKLLRLFGSDALSGFAGRQRIASEALLDISRGAYQEVLDGSKSLLMLQDSVGKKFIDRQHKLRADAAADAKRTLAIDKERLGTGAFGAEGAATRARTRGVLSFQEITSRSSLAGIAAGISTQKVEDKQLAETNRLLREQRDASRRSPAGRLGA